MKVALRRWVSEGIPQCVKINRDADVVTTAVSSVWLSQQSLRFSDAACGIKSALCCKNQQTVEMLEDSKTNINSMNGAFFRFKNGISVFIWCFVYLK